ncbi:MAG TPA: DUF368 domain-containing protein [Firmicutes bacterium]|nr:DUF368 domain-containing protein [Bacillota bacterium]
MEEENKGRDVIFTTPAQEEPVSPSPKETEVEDAQAAGSSQPSGQPGEGGEQPSEPDLRYKNGKEVAKSGVLGFFIGLAVIVPGVSGSTVAIIFRLYDKLLYALGNIVRRFRACIKFLLPIAVGLLIGFVLGFLAIQRLIDISPFAIIGLFAGLMVGSFPAVYDEIRREKKTPLRVGLFALGVAIPVAISVLSVFLSEGAHSLEGLHAGHYILFLVLGYLVAVTQVVPGLSATAILMAFGYFSSIMESVSFTYWQHNPAVFGVYACLIVGFLLGLVTFSKLLTKIFAKRRAAAFFVIVGLSLGSIVTMFFNPDVYAVYQSWTTNLNVLDLSLGLVLFAVGIVAAYLFVRYERSKKGLLPTRKQ